MAAADTPAERTMFVRKATGLVKGWSVFDAFIYSAFAINLMALGFGYAFTGIAFFPKGALIAAIVLSGLFIIFEVIAYASMIAVMPRAGGDYVWQSRVFGGGFGFVLAATGWWFILWHWVPIYAQILCVEVLQPLLHDPRLHRHERVPRRLVAVLGHQRQRHLRRLADHGRDRHRRGRDGHAHVRAGPEVVLLSAASSGS